MTHQVPSPAVGGMVICSLIALLVAAYSQRVATAARRRAAGLEQALKAANAPRTAGPDPAEYLVALVAGVEVGAVQHALQALAAIRAERHRVDELVASFAATAMAAARTDARPWSPECRTGQTAGAGAGRGSPAAPWQRPVAGGGADARR